MIPRQSCLFRIASDGRVESEWDRDLFSEAVKDCRCCEMTIYGMPDQSLIPIHAVAEFFDVKADWEYEWEYRSNEWIAPDILVAVIQAW